MITHKKGNLLTSDCTVIMHQANCFSVMGAGIARTIADIYPAAKKADLNFPYSPEERLGKYSLAKTKNKVIVNLYGQYKFGRGLQTDYKALEKSLDSFFTDVKEDNLKIGKVGIPYLMGCGLAGGDWKIVSEILYNQSEKHGVEIYTYEYTPEIY